MNNTWLNWLFDELTHIQQFPRSDVGLVVLAAAGTWYLADFLSRTQISNLQSEVAAGRAECPGLGRGAMLSNDIK